MEGQSPPPSSYEAYTRYDDARRQSGLPPINTQGVVNPGELTIPRHMLSGPAVHPMQGHMQHPVYDPVHDVYTAPRGPVQGNPHLERLDSTAFSRQEFHPSYGQQASPGRFIPPVRPSSTAPHPEYRRERPQFTPSHDLESLSYRVPTHTQGPGQHSFRIQNFAQGDTNRRLEASSSLTPLEIPTTPPGDERGSSSPKRIVMACHQCRARKIRCDAERPSCKNCLRRREECRYDEKPKRRGPDKVPGSRMRSCKSKRQSMGYSSPSDPSGSTSFFSQMPSP